MFGNLSKTLIKAPHYFNNNIDTDPNNNTKLSAKFLLDTYSNIRQINTRNSNSRYFKERDFVKKNLSLDLNYNNNYRKKITPTVVTNKNISFEEFIFGNSNNNSKNTSQIVTKKSLYKTNKSNTPNLTNKSNMNKSVDDKNTHFSKFQNFLDKKLIPKNSIEEFNKQVDSNIDYLIGKINQNSLNFNQKENKLEKRRIDRIENLKNYINKNTVVEPPVKLKFPDLFIKSNDTLYREAMDKKMKSLSMVSPKIKEQLKSKNRVFASGKDYYRYNNYYNMYKQNPFYESVKYIEENNNKEIV